MEDSIALLIIVVLVTVAMRTYYNDKDAEDRIKALSNGNFVKVANCVQYKDEYYCDISNIGE